MGRNEDSMTIIVMSLNFQLKNFFFFLSFPAAMLPPTPFYSVNSNNQATTFWPLSKQLTHLLLFSSLMICFIIPILRNLFLNHITFVFVEFIT